MRCYANDLPVRLFTFQGDDVDSDANESGRVENVTGIELVPCLVASLMPINITSELLGQASSPDRVWYVVATVQGWIRALRSTARCSVI